MKKVKKIHMVGIGGIGMSGIAQVLINQGFTVEGSDLKESEITRDLARLGAHVSAGHAAANLGEADVVVISSAVGSDNPEVAEARRRGIPVVRRAEMLAELMRLKTGIAVAGSHGKTTTTSLLSAALSEAGMDPTYVIGGRLKSNWTGARLGNSEYLVAEADESDGSFLLLAPIYVVVTNIDREHMDHYGEMTKLEEAFLTFINRIPFFGRAVLNLDDVLLARLIPSIHRPRTTYGFSRSAEYRAENVRCDGMKMRYDLIRRGRSAGEIRLGLLGQHNVSNSLGVIAMAEELGIELDVIRRALEGFSGVGRRFEVHYREKGYLIVDEYGHHPTEVRATLATARLAHEGRLVVIFQPHRFSRTYDLLREFQTAFDPVDVLYLLDIYSAGETDRWGVTSRDLAEALRGAGGPREVRHLEKSGPLKDPAVLAGILDRIERDLRPGDMIVTMGAGDVTLLAPGLRERLEKRNEP